MARSGKTFFLLILIILALSGCQTALPDVQTPAPPTTTIEDIESTATLPVEKATETAENTPTSETIDSAVVITPENAARLSLIDTLDLEDYPGRIFWASDSQTLAVTTQNSIYLIDGNTLDIIQKFSPKDENSNFISLSPDGYTAAYSSIHEDQKPAVDLIDIRSGEILHSFEDAELFNYVAAFSPDGKTLAIASVDQIAALLFDLSDGYLLKIMTGYETAAPVYSFSFTPDQHSLLWISRAKAQLMNIESGELGPEFRHEDFIGHAAVSHDGNTLVCTSAATVEDLYTPIIQLWDTHSGESKGQLVTISDGEVSISPDDFLLAGANGPYLFVWDFASLQELAILDGVSPGIISVAFSPNGKTLASLAQDNTLRIWQVLP